MTDKFVFLCEILVTSAPMHVKPLTTKTEDGAVVDRQNELPTIKLPRLLFVDDKKLFFLHM